MKAFVHPARFTPDEDDGGFVVTFRDLPKAITQGDSIEQAVREARDEELGHQLVIGVEPEIPKQEAAA